ncbi:hypothetical protein LPB86_16430 [Pedobacter sp. MC2016-14]|uniref:hypothetical protein n=1 Tax=Pedobacter sp. MC2016-14 TaxID=2897327 RepID=UPI001E58FFE6|nr:hypothetical protein [Pedobacter sp. MC2016-14]MCD0489832.1 hypothetical protein [Pedobacter sp. MC2016-14]
MKTTISTLLKFACSAAILSIAFTSCKQKQEQYYVPRPITANESFNEPLAQEGALLITKVASAGNAAEPELFTVKYKNNAVNIQPDSSNAASINGKFAFAQFVNTQKTCILVQLADSSGLVAPFYLIALKDNKLEVISLYRQSTGERDLEFTRGKDRIANAGFLINNDFVVTNVNAKVYFIKRPVPDERIQGSFIASSPDKKTLVFLVGSKLYQLHYPSGDTFIQPLNASVAASTANVYAWVQKNYRWQRNKNGIAFLKSIENGDEIIDMRRPQS